MSRSSRNLTRMLVCSGWLLASIAGCAGARRPVAGPLGADDPRPAALLAALLETSASRHALRGIARVALDGPNGAGRVKQIVVLERPARLRVEILGLLDQTLALLVTDGTRYRLVRSDGPPVEEGAVDEALLAEVAGLSLSPELAVGVLLAAPYAGVAPQRIGGGSLPDGGVRVVVAPDATTRDALDFDADARLRRWARLGADGEPLVEARFDDWSPLGTTAFPRELVLTDHATEARAALSWSRIELDPALPPALFEVDPRP